MADKVTWELSGVNEVLANLQSLAEVPQSRAGRSAMRAAANVIRDAAIRNSKVIDDPDTPNQIFANIAVQFNSRLFRRTGDLGFRVGVAGGAKYRLENPGKKGPGGDTWYWRLREFGTKDTKAHPFIRPALSNNTQEATAQFFKRFQAAITAQRRLEKRQYAAMVRQSIYGKVI